MQFNNLSIGDTFDFLDDTRHVTLLYRRCVKTGDTTYREIDGAPEEFSIDSADSTVYHVERRAMFRTVSADQWADFTSDYRTYATEYVTPDGRDMMLNKDRETKIIVSRVTYHPDGARTYEIDEESAARCEKIDFAKKVK